MALDTAADANVNAEAVHQSGAGKQVRAASLAHGSENMVGFAFKWHSTPSSNGRSLVFSLRKISIFRTLGICIA
jgi:hypothetical protein